MKVLLAVHVWLMVSLVVFVARGYRVKGFLVGTSPKLSLVLLAKTRN